MSLFVMPEISGRSVHTLTVDHTLLIWNNRQPPIQLILYKKLNFFSKLFAQFLKLKSNFEHFEKIGDPHS